MRLPLLHRVPPSAWVAGAALVLFVYFYVPTVRTCYGRLEWNTRDNTIVAHCPEPDFSVPCLADRRYAQESYYETSLCRTSYGRLVRIVDNTKRQTNICYQTWGWLSSYDRLHGCHCDYHSVGGPDGKCIMTDETCEDFYGSGATAYVSDPKLGYPDQCACPLDLSPETCTAPQRDIR